MLNWRHLLDFEKFGQAITEFSNRLALEQCFNMLESRGDTLEKDIIYYCDNMKFHWYSEHRFDPEYIEACLKTFINDYDLVSFFNAPEDLELKYDQIRNSLYNLAADYIDEYFVKEDATKEMLRLGVLR